MWEKYFFFQMYLMINQCNKIVDLNENNKEMKRNLSVVNIDQTLLWMYSSNIDIHTLCQLQLLGF